MWQKIIISVLCEKTKKKKRNLLMMKEVTLSPIKKDSGKDFGRYNSNGYNDNTVKDLVGFTVFRTVLSFSIICE